MFKAMLALHLLFAVFAVGPLVHAATNASRGIRRSDGPAMAASARMTRIYSYASILTIIFGFALMSTTSSRTHKKVAEFSDTWIWVSALLWLIAIGIALGLIAPALDRATKLVADGGSAKALTARVAAGGGIVGVIFAVIVFLMVYRPGG